MKKGVRKILAVIIIAMMFVTMIPMGSQQVYAGSGTREIWIGSELELNHGTIGLLIKTDDTPWNPSPEYYEFFGGSPGIAMNTVPITVIDASGTVRYIEEGQEAHVVWDPDVGYYYYSGNVRYIPRGEEVTLIQPPSPSQGYDDTFVAPDSSVVGDYLIEINGVFKPFEYNLSLDSSVEHGTISGTVIDAKGNEREYNGTAKTDETVYLNFVPEEGYELRRDSVEVIQTLSNYSVSVSANYTLGEFSFTMPYWGATVKAVFQKPEESSHKVMLDQVYYGAGTATVDKEWAMPGETVTVTLTPGETSVYTPVSISAGSNLSGNPTDAVPAVGAQGQVTFTMPATDVTVSYGFMDALRDVSVGGEVVLENGSVEINGTAVAAGGVAQIVTGGEFTATLIPDSGYKISHANIMEKPGKTVPEDLQDLGSGSYKFTAAPLTWAEYIRQQGKKVTVVVPDMFPDFLHWLPGSETVVRYDKHPELVEKLF